MAVSRCRLVSTDRRAGVLWPVVVAAVLLFTGLSSSEAGAGATTWHTPPAAAGLGHAHGQGERDGEVGTGDYEAARARNVVRRLGLTRDLGHVPLHHPPAAHAASRHWDPVCRVVVPPGPHARHSGRSPGARLLIALNVSRT